MASDPESAPTSSAARRPSTTSSTSRIPPCCSTTCACARGRRAPADCSISRAAPARSRSVPRRTSPRSGRWTRNRKQSSSAAEGAQARIDNVGWIAGRAKDVQPRTSPSSSWPSATASPVERRVVAEAAMHWLVPGGHLAVLWSNSPWTGREAWQHAMAEAVRHSTDAAGAAERIPANIGASGGGTAHDAARERRLHHRGRVRVHDGREWTVETLTGFMYTTSFLSRPGLRRKRPALSATSAPACWR